MSKPDIYAEALQRYERAAGALGANLDGIVNGWDAAMPEWPVPAYSPLRNRLPRFAEWAWEKQREEARDRRAWVRNVQRRLGLVGPGASPHHATVRRVPAGYWGWSCRQLSCAVGTRYRSQLEAFADAYLHATGRLVVRATPSGVTVERRL